MREFLRTKWLVLFLGLVLPFEFLAAEAIVSNAIVVDEYAHLPAGVAYWRDAMFSMYDENPPLPRYLVALPAYLRGARMDYTNAGRSRRWEWEVGVDFRRANRERYLSYFVWGRFFVVALAVACGALIFLWAGEEHGGVAALVGAALWFTDPNVLAHATIATSDLAAAAFGFLATYLFGRFLRRPGRGGAVLAGVGLGLALGSKFTLVLLVPIWALMALAFGRPRTAAGTIAPLPRYFLQFGAILLMALTVIHLLYQFRGAAPRLGSMPFTSPMLTGSWAGRPEEAVVGNRFAGSWIGALPAPMPRDYCIGFDSQLFDQQKGRFAHLSGGRLVNGGSWSSPLKVLGLKMPLGTLLLVTASGVFLALRLRRMPPAWRIVWIPPLALVGFLCAQGGGLNFAYRYTLPALPFLLVATGALVRVLWESRAGRAAVLACLLWNAASLLRTRPAYLAFGNELAGGPAGAQQQFLGSNFDWGQDLFRLKHWYDRHPEVRPLAMSVYGAFHPGELGIEARPLPPCFAAPREDCRDEGAAPVFYWAISSNLLNGLAGLIAGHDGVVRQGIVSSPDLTPEAACARRGHDLHLSGRDRRCRDPSPRHAHC